MYELKVKASLKYGITVARDLNALGEKTAPFMKGEKVAVVTDDNVFALYGDVIDCLAAGKTVVKIVLKHGERHKNAASYLKIINTLAENGFTREDTVIAFGGGVVGDVAAFAASTYMRGITLIAVPTTLLSMIDSSVGGKTAIDLKCGKNLCGTFYQPSAVYINFGFLRTLPEKEMKNGLGELAKYALLSRKVTEKDIKSPTMRTIYNCLKIKRDIVNKDEKEKGIRAYLNLGHTVGHAIEKLSGYRVPHGIAVANGLVYAVKVSAKIYGISDAESKRVFSAIKATGIKFRRRYPAKAITEEIYNDKKRRGSDIVFAAIKGAGEPSTVKISVKDLGALLEEIDGELTENGY